METQQWQAFLSWQMSDYNIMTVFYDLDVNIHFFHMLPRVRLSRNLNFHLMVVPKVKKILMIPKVVASSVTDSREVYKQRTFEEEGKNRVSKVHQLGHLWFTCVCGRHAHLPQRFQHLPGNLPTSISAHVFAPFIFT